MQILRNLHKWLLLWVVKKISCDGFDEFEPVFDNKLSSSISSGKKITVTIPTKYSYDFAFSCDNGQVLLYNIQDNKILVNENVSEIYYFNTVGGEELIVTDKLKTALYSAVYVLSDKLLNDDAEKLFYVLKDNFYYRMLVNAFGKQKLNAFKASIKDCVVDLSKRYPEGISDIKKVDDNAFCLMNLIQVLADSNTLFYPNHSDFNYNRIGRKKVAIGDKLVEADQEKLAAAKNVQEMIAIAKELEDKKINTEMIKNVKIDENYYLVSSQVNVNDVVVIDKKINHVFVVDVSGSMYHELPLIRKQLKNKLSNVMRDGDTISIIWFSGRNDAGILKEEVEVKSLKTLNDLNDAIDRWLVPMGCTLR